MREERGPRFLSSQKEASVTPLSWDSMGTLLKDDPHFWICRRGKKCMAGSRVGGWGGVRGTSIFLSIYAVVTSIPKMSFCLGKRQNFWL